MKEKYVFVHVILQPRLYAAQKSFSCRVLLLRWKPMIRKFLSVYNTGPENHKSLRWISAGYPPPHDIRFVANERRAPLPVVPVNEMNTTPRKCTSVTCQKQCSTLIGHKQDLIRWISDGYPSEGLMNFSAQGFPKKDARFPKIKHIPDLLSDDEEGLIM